ncbi:MAG TPA: hypothetical protein VJ349_13780, partial [Stellaceae bacterium]|nr:hypothetical protein [Stellaceae bacterium]
LCRRTRGQLRYTALAAREDRPSRLDFKHYELVIALHGCMTRSFAGGRRAEATVLPTWVKPQPPNCSTSRQKGRNRYTKSIR